MRFVAVVCIALFSTGSAFTGAMPVSPQSTYPDRLKQFLSQTNSPVLFVGRVRDVYTGYLPCTGSNNRQVTWDVSRVLYGFTLSKQVSVDFPSCGVAEAPFLTHSEMLVIAYPGYRNVWLGMKDSVVPADDANIGLANKLMDDGLRRRVRDVVRPARSAEPRTILAFNGTVLDAGPESDRSIPCRSTVPPTFRVRFTIDAVLHGTWAGKEATVSFPGCGPSAYPPLRTGQRMVVFMEIMASIPPPDILRGELVLPTSQSEQVKRALESADPPAQSENVPASERQTY
jgi:hypothetical protein